MRLIKIVSQRKFILISMILFVYVMLNLLEGERGLISYYKNIQLKEQLTIEERLLRPELASVEKKNNLLTNLVDLDYLEILYRRKFMLGKEKENIFTNN